MERLFLKIILVFLATLTVTFASNKCPTIPTSKVTEIFKSKNVKFVSADSSGTCFWHVNNQGDILMTNVIKQPTIKQAGELFITYEKTYFPKFTDYISRPKIGDKAFIGMKKSFVTLPSGEKVDEVHIHLVILEKDTIYTFFYDVSDKSNINANTVSGLEKIGSIALSSPTKPNQSFGKCTWFLPKELNKLLGKKGQIIQSLGDERCIAYINPGNATLTAMGASLEESSFTIMKNSNKEMCKTQELPHISKSAYAYYDCPAPAAGVINVELLKGDHHMSVTYQPNGRRASSKDIDTMETLLKHIIKKL